MKVSRRELLMTAASAVALGSTGEAQSATIADPTRVRGRAARPVGERALRQSCSAWLEAPPRRAHRTRT
jgi:hypothetical protein